MATPPTPAAPSKALTIAAFGARGTGKTAWIRQQLQKAKPPRLAIWDFKHDDALEGLGTPVADLPSFARALRRPKFSVRYLVDHKHPVLTIARQFDLFCDIAWEAGRLVMYVAELPEVTKSNRAPAPWRRCVNVGRSYKGSNGEQKWLSIVADGQRPAECDKSFISNADVIHTGRLSNASDARELAQSLGCDYRELLALPDLHFIERSAGQVEPVRGVLSFSNKRTSTRKTS